MQNVFAIETEAEYRRRELKREAAAEALAAQAQPERGGMRWPRLLRLLLARLCARFASPAPLTSWRNAAVTSMSRQRNRTPWNASAR